MGENGFSRSSRSEADRVEMTMTQDLCWCKKAREAGKTFAVGVPVKVSHTDPNTGIFC